MASINTSFSPVLHGLRGVAALCVVVFHWYQIFPAFGRVVGAVFPADSMLNPASYLGFGWIGVPLFFVLSGYLLGAKVISEPITLTFVKTFWLRRCLRIYPAVWVHLICLLLAAPLVVGLVTQRALDSLALQFSLWINMPPQMEAPISNVLWTLPIELSFYFLLPFVGLMSRKVSWYYLLSLSAVITLSWRLYWVGARELDNYVLLLPYLDMLPGTLFTFMVGYSLNFLPRIDSARHQIQGLVACAASLMALLQWQLLMNDVYWTGHWILAIWPPMIAAAVGLMVYFLNQPFIVVKPLINGTMLWLGSISFGVYLWHYPIMRSMKLLQPELWTSPVMSLLAFPIALLITLPVASLSYKYIEQPLMGWRPIG